MGLRLISSPSGFPCQITSDSLSHPLPLMDNIQTGSAGILHPSEESPMAQNPNPEKKPKAVLVAVQLPGDSAADQEASLKA